MPGETNITFRIPSDLKHELSLEAARDTRSMSQIAVIALRKYLEEKRGEKK